MISNETYLIGCPRRFRESGEAIIMTDQSISHVHNVVKGNLYTVICLGQRDTKDMRESIEILCLNPQQAEIINILEAGQGVARLAARYPHPVQINFPLVEPEYISDQDLDQINDNDPMIAYLKSLVKPRLSDAPEIASSKPTEEELSDNEKRFIIVIYPIQFKKSLTEIYEIAGFSAGTASRLAKTCEKKGLIQIIKTSLKSGSPRYPVLLDKAYEMMNLPKKNYYGKGAGYEHIVYQHLVADHLAEYKPTIELNRKDKFIDVAVQNNENLFCIEIEMSAAHVKENIEKDMLVGAHWVIVACLNNKVKAQSKEIVAGLSDETRSRTKVILISELLAKSPSEIVSEP